MQKGRPMLKVMQIAMNTADLAGSLRLYSDVFGFRNALGQALWGDLIRIQGLPPSSRALTWWMVGSQSEFQLELFHHTVPPIRAKADDWRPSDRGWVRFGVRIDAFDDRLGALAQQGIGLLAPVLGAAGERAAAFRDPYSGVVVHIIEDESATTGPVVDYVTSSVSDLDGARHFYGAIFGLELSPTEHCQQSAEDALWNLPSAAKSRFYARAGDIRLEIVQYIDPPGRARPADYRIGDQGIPNVGLGADDVAEAAAIFDRLASIGIMPPHIIKGDGMLAGYVTEAEREIELFALPAKFLPAIGYAAGPPFLNDAFTKS